MKIIKTYHLERAELAADSLALFYFHFSKIKFVRFDFFYYVASKEFYHKIILN